MTEEIVERTVYVPNVSFNVMPEYSFTIQNAASFTWEHIVLPQPIANVTSAKHFEASVYTVLNK